MKAFDSRTGAACAALAAACLPFGAWSQPAGVEARADALLRATTTYMAGLQQFSLTTENMLEAVTTDGQKIQFVMPAAMTVARPDKMFAERVGVSEQMFIYDGKTLTLFNPGTGHYATVPAPANLDAMFEFAQAKLDVFAPGTDLIDTQAYAKLMQDVKTGRYLGIEAVGGQRCHHLAYQGAEVDWQLWVREGDRPQPCRYLITTKGMTGAPQFTVQFLAFDASPKIDAGLFRFVPPAGARAVEFLPSNPAR